MFKFSVQEGRFSFRVLVLCLNNAMHVRIGKVYLTSGCDSHLGKH